MSDKDIARQKAAAELIKARDAAADLARAGKINSIDNSRVRSAARDWDKARKS